MDGFKLDTPSKHSFCLKKKLFERIPTILILTQKRL